ncbi:MAG: hypothetical protein HRF50_08040 [Phycisphaerae bacterium]|jgi:hypothetical protein
MSDARTCESRTVKREARGSLTAAPPPQEPLPDLGVLGARIQEAAMVRAIAAILARPTQQPAGERLS